MFLQFLEGLVKCKALGTEPKETGVQGPAHGSLNQRRDPRYLGQHEFRKYNKTIENLNQGEFETWCRRTARPYEE